MNSEVRMTKKIALEVVMKTVTGAAQKGVAKFASFMGRMYAVTLKDIVKNSADASGKVSKNMQNLIPADFYKRIDAVSQTLGKMGTAMSYYVWKYDKRLPNTAQGD